MTPHYVAGRDSCYTMPLNPKAALELNQEVDHVDFYVVTLMHCLEGINPINRLKKQQVCLCG
jgi:hypothetical protein